MTNIDKEEYANVRSDLKKIKFPFLKNNRLHYPSVAAVPTTAESVGNFARFEQRSGFCTMCTCAKLCIIVQSCK